MSYILDALKKSETQRSHGEAPSLLGAPPPAPLLTAKVLVMIAVALLLNAGLLAAWWLWPRPLAPVVDPAPASTVSPAVPGASPPSTVTTAGAVATAGAPPSQVEAPVPDPTPPTVQTSAAPPPQTVEAPPPQTVRFSALQADEQRAFNGLEFSTHVFADDPDLRAVTLNGKRFTEGEALTNELTLDKITEDGVVVRFRGKFVELPVLQDWRI